MSSELTSNDLQFKFRMRELSGSRVYEFEDFTLDADHLLLFRKGVQVGLTPKVVETLLALVERPGEVMSKDALMQSVWPDSIVDESNLSQNLYLLRKTLGKTSSGEQFIETLRRRGYRFSPAVTVSNSPFPASAQRPLKVSRRDNIVRVIDWQTSPESAQVAEKAPQPILSSRARRFTVAVVLIAAAAILLMSVAAFRYVSQASAVPAAAMPEFTFTHLTNGVDVNYAALSPDGKSFVYNEVNGDTCRLWLQQTGDSHRIELMPPFTGTLLSKSFTPDGLFIYVTATEKDAAHSSLFRIPVSGGQPATIAENVGETVAVSPDGTQIAFIRHAAGAAHSSIILAGADGGSEHVLIDGQGGSTIWGGLAWSPDARSIAYGSVSRIPDDREGACTINKIDLQDAAVRKLSGESWDTCGRMEWTPDGSGLLFIGTRKGESLSTRRDQLYLLSIANGKARRLTSEGSRLQVSSLGVSADGSVLVVPFNRSSQLWAMDAGGDAASAKQITNGLNDGRAGIAPLPDGRIGFVARSGENLNVWLVNQDGSDQRQITSSPSNVEELRTSPDGKSFFFSSLTDGKPVLYACDQEGGNIRRVPIGDGFNVDSAISPDGNWIAFSSAASENGALKETIRAAVATGGESFPIAGPMAVNPRFSPDGRFLSYIGAGDSLHVSTFPSGSIVAEFKSAPGAVLNTGAKWSPDGGSLAYIVRTAGVGNIWLQPLDGSGSHPLTNFSSGEILNFEFSANGKHLILARGYPIRDAVLLKASPAVPNG